MQPLFVQSQDEQRSSQELLKYVPPVPPKPLVYEDVPALILYSVQPLLVQSQDEQADNVGVPPVQAE